MGKRAVGALVAGIVALSACATSQTSSDTAPPTTGAVPTSSPRATPTTRATTRPHTTTTARASPTRPATTFSFDDSVPPPKFIDTGTDYVAILKSFRLYCAWLASHHPDPALIASVEVPGRTYDAFRSDLMWFRANGQRAIEVLRGSVRYTILSTRPDAFSARAVEDIVAHQVVDARGRMISDVRYTTPTTYLMLAVRMSGKWRLASVTVQQAVDVHL